MPSMIPVTPKKKPEQQDIPVQPANPSDPPPLAGVSDQSDESERVVPPPPELPSGKFLCQFKEVNRWISKETGKPAINTKTGEPSIPVIVFQVVDPAEKKKAMAGKPSCFMSEDITIRLDFQGRWYDRLVKQLTQLGCGSSTWPKGKNGGQPTESQLCDHITATCTGKRWFITTKLTPGKGEYKDRPPFVNVEKIEPAT